MGRSDESKKLFWEDDERFADLINTIFGQGEVVINAADLKKSSEALHIGKANGKALFSHAGLRHASKLSFAAGAASV